MVDSVNNQLHAHRAAGDRLVAVRPMAASDLDMVDDWLQQPHVARWWGNPTDELTRVRRRILEGADAGTRMLIVSADDRPVGLAQWYRWDDYPDEARAIGARRREVGMDYALGDPAAIGRGLGHRMIAALVRHIRCEQAGAGFLVGPDAANWPSRSVLTGNGFALVAVRPVATEPKNDPIAIYRLDSPPLAWPPSPTPT